MDGPPVCLRSLREALVVANKTCEGVSEQAGGGEMDSVQGSKVAGFEGSRRGEYPIADPNEIDEAQYVTRPSHCFLSKGEDSPGHLGAGQGARHHRSATAQILAERLRLGFAHDQLHDR